MNTEQPQQPSTPPTLKTAEVAHLLRTSEQTLERMRASGTGPAFVKVGREFRYPTSALIDWIAANATVPA